MKATGRRCARGRSKPTLHARMMHINPTCHRIAWFSGVLWSHPAGKTKALDPPTSRGQRQTSDRRSGQEHGPDRSRRTPARAACPFCVANATIQARVQRSAAPPRLLPDRQVPQHRAARPPDSVCGDWTLAPLLATGLLQLTGTRPYGERRRSQRRPGSAPALLWSPSPHAAGTGRAGSIGLYQWKEDHPRVSEKQPSASHNT